MSTTTKSDEFIGVPEAAELLGIHRQTLRAAVHRGEVPALRIGRQFRIRTSDLEAMKTA